MLATTFNLPNGDSLPAIQNDEGEWFFSAQDTCTHAEISSSKNATTWIKNNVPPKWYMEIKIPGKEGRPSMYLSKPGFYFAVCQGRSLKAMNFRDWVFEDLLVKLEASGGYIMPTATSEQIQALRQELDQRDAYIDHQEKTIDYLVDCKHVKEIVYQFAMNNIEYTPDKKYIASGTLWDMWVDWSDKHYHRRGRKLIKIYQEDFRKYMRELFPKTDKRFYVDPKNGYADVEHARVKPTIDPFGE